jgi:hypothetical protein
MGYSTTFKNKFNLNKPLDEVTYNFLLGLGTTRRMARNVDKKYGVEGEFYVENDDLGVVNSDKQPKTQSGLWCQWVPTEDHMAIEWDGGEKFYNYVQWIEYLISKVLAPRGYVLNGTVEFEGEDRHDYGEIEIVENNVNGKRLITDYSINKLLGLPKQTVSIKPLADVVSKVAAKKFNSSTLTQNQQVVVQVLEKQKKEKDMKKTELIEEIDRLKTELQKKVEDLKSKDKELAKIKANEEKIKLTITDALLKNIQQNAGVKGSLEDFKEMLKNLLK